MALLEYEEMKKRNLQEVRERAALREIDLFTADSRGLDPRATATGPETARDFRSLDGVFTTRSQRSGLRLTNPDTRNQLEDAAAGEDSGRKATSDAEEKSRAYLQDVAKTRDINDLRRVQPAPSVVGRKEVATFPNQLVRTRKNISIPAISVPVSPVNVNVHARLDLRTIPAVPRDMAEFVQLKIYFELEQEVRRFNIPVRQANNGTRHPAEAFDDQGQAETLYGCIVKKIKDKLHHGNFRLTWKDSNGDSILFDSDEELQVALVPSADGVGQTLAIYVKTSTPPDYQKPSASLFMPSFQGPRQPGGFVFGGPKVENPHPHGLEKHSGVLCDGCDQKIVGTRYKCLACPDYDLCLKCEFKGVHCEHDSVAIRKPNQLEWRKLFAARESTYGRNRPLGTTRSQDGPVVELDLNLNQPLESLLRDVNTQVQKVLKGFMPQSIPEATVMTVTKTEAPPVVEVKDRQETLVETVVRDEAPIREKASADDQVEILHEIVVEQGTAKLGDKVATESIYPQLATATEQAETISLAESRRSSSPNLFSVDSSDDEDWALVSDNVSMTSKDAMAEIVETPSLAKDSPSAQIEAALTAMGEMGFKNEGNLLRALLENFHGDIGKVLDTIGN